MRRMYYRYSLWKGVTRYPSRLWATSQSVRRALVVLVALAFTIFLNLPSSLNGTKKVASITPVPGQSYQICNDQAQYLTSPWTYNGLASGSQQYTVAQYEALPGYGTTLPPLPSYIASEPSTTTAAAIYAPGSTPSAAAYNFPETPILYFFEGGSYGYLGFQSISGDEFIGGSASGFAEPSFNDGGSAGGISAGNDTYGFSGGAVTLTVAANAGDTTVTTSAALPAYSAWITFSDGSTYQIASTSGTSTTLSSALTSAEASGSTAWANSNPPLTTVSAGAAQGSTSLTFTNSSIPLVKWSSVVVGTDTYTVNSVTGTQSGYTVGINGRGLDTAVAANTPVYYDAVSGGVTVQYLNISNDIHDTTGTITLGTGWTVENNYIHDGYRATAGGGVAFYGGDESTIEYNCFARMGQYGAGGSGTNQVFDYNEVTQSAFRGDPGCGCSGGGKWWGTLNADIVDNAFVEDGIGGDQSDIWFDNGNSGALVEGNYFYKDAGSAVTNETGFNMKVDNNLFLDDGWGDGTGQPNNSDGAININSTGGINIPGSRFENQVIITGNQFINDWEGLTIWQSDQRNCLGSGEGWPVDSAYCSGGFPITDTTQANGQYYFSHQGDIAHGGTKRVAQPATSGSTTLMVEGPEAIDDQIDFHNSSATTTADTTNITTFTGSGTITVGSTSGFPTSGQLSVGTTGGNAVLTYTGTTATTFTGVSLVADQLAASTGTLTGSVAVSDPAYAKTADTTDVTTFAGSGTITVPSTTGFPSSGQLRVDTSAASGGGGFTGAILRYTGTTSTTFTGVSLDRGTGTLSGAVQQVQPYKVTAETCFSNDCNLTVTPALAANVSSDTIVTNAGTCPLYATATALPSGPLAPSSTSYWDGCQWQSRNVSVSNNTFVFQPSLIAHSAPPMGTATTTACTTANSCGTNFMAFQSGGTKPFFDQTGGNGMMSSSTFTGCPDWDTGCITDPLANINADANPPAAQANNGEAPYNNVWSGNTYAGPWTISDAFSYSGCWPLPTDTTSGNTMPQADCGSISLPTWQSAWQQDQGSTYNPMAVTIGNLTSGQMVHGAAQPVTAYEDSESGKTINSSLLVGATTDTTVAPLASTPYTFNLNTLNYHDGPYTLEVSATDSASRTGNDSVPVVISNGDLNADGKVNLSDLAIMAAHWGQTDSNYPDGNITGQGTINISDLAVMAANWGWVQ